MRHLLYLSRLSSFLILFCGASLSTSFFIPMMRTNTVIRVADSSDQFKEEALIALQQATKLREDIAAAEKNFAPRSLPDDYERLTAIERAKKLNEEVKIKDDEGGLRDKVDCNRYIIRATVGREEGMWMPPKWGASGTRIRFEFLIVFSLGGKIEDIVLRSPFVDIDLTGDAWIIDEADATDNRSQSVLRFSVKSSGYERGNTSIPQGLLYFAIPVWGSIVSKKEGIISVRRKKWFFIEESVILGVFQALKVE